MRHANGRRQTGQTFVGSRARLEASKILHGYTFPVFEDNESDFTVVLSPTNEDGFSIRRQ